MKKGHLVLFLLYILSISVVLVVINYYRESLYLLGIHQNLISAFSALFILLIVFSFFYREMSHNRNQNEFITIVTHKFRTPLTGIHWAIDMMQKDLTLLEKKDLLLELQKSNDRLIEIVNLFVDFVKFDKRLEYAFGATSLREIVEASLQKYSNTIKLKNIKFSVDSARELPMIIIDRMKIQFVVDMLFDNALKYTPAGGEVKASFKVSNKAIILQVADSGIGLKSSDARKLFHKFYRAENAKLANTEGLGLSLYTARKIMEKHHGQIWVESKGLNKGSTFFLQLPIKR